MWGTVLKLIPWGQVIDHAPEVIEAAKKLYGQLVKDKPAEEGGLNTSTPTEDLTEMERLQLLAESNRQELLKLHQDIEESGKVIRDLAEQNAQMIGEIEKLRRKSQRTSWLGLALFLIVLYLFYRLQAA